jgi:hypothetical protein
MSPASNFEDDLEKYVERVKEFHDSCRDSEAATKASLIMPLFKILGYDETDPRVCHPEDKAKFGTVKSKQPVDWAFSVNNSLAFLVEAKAVGKKIDHYDEQLGGYYAKQQGKVKLGILTTGVQWRFFTDLDNENVMDNEPFLEWDVLNGSIPYEFLTNLQREKFSPEYIKNFAKEKHCQSFLVAELTRLLEPSDDFVKLAIQNKVKRYLNAKVIQEWKPRLARAIHEWVQQKSLTEALDHAIDTDDQQPNGDPAMECRDFWEPIRREGLFEGKLSNRPWIYKTIRGIDIALIVCNHTCCVDIAFKGENRKQRREKAVNHLSALKDKYPRDTEKIAYVRFPVLEMGIKDRKHWTEIREKLKSVGENIYNELSRSDV